MPSTPNLDISSAYSANSPAATDRVNATQLDSDHLAVENWANEELLPSLAQVIRDDDTLVDGIVRSRNLHPEVSLLIASKAGWQPKTDVQASSLTNINLSAPGATIDGRNMVNGDRFLAKNQTDAGQNGIYVWNGAAVAATRATDADTSSELGYAFVSVAMDSGTSQVGTSWVCNQSASDITSLGVTSVTFCQVGANLISLAMQAVTSAQTLAAARAAMGPWGDKVGFVDIRDYGAVGGGADDTVAIQAAIDSGKSVYIPEGVWVVGEPGLYHVDGMRMFGDGRTKSILKKKANIGANDQLSPILMGRPVDTVFTPAYDITIERIGFEGNGSSVIKTNKAAGLVRFYEIYGFRAVDCSFYKGRGYGIGMQGTPASPDVDKRGPHVDIYIENCDFYENGKQEYLLGADTDDGIDFKSSDRATVINCRAWDNGDKGFDLKGNGLTVVGCKSWNNIGVGFAHGIKGVLDGVTSVEDASAVFTNCLAWSNGQSGFAVIPQVTPGVVDGRIYTHYVGCIAWDNVHNWNVTTKGTNDLAVSRIVLTGCLSKDPKTGYRHFLASAALESLTITGGSFVGGSTTGISVHSSQVGPFNICGATIENSGSTAISGSSDNSARTNIIGCVFRNIGSTVFSGASNTTISGNTYENITASGRFSFTGTNNRVLDKELGSRTVASAGSVTLPEITDFFIISGTTNITTIVASWSGRVVVMRFSGILTVTDGDNLLLAGNFVTASNNTLTLICDGTNWTEISRSVN